MTIRTITFEDFGVYAGLHRIELAPVATGRFGRPIVLFHGKNGVGKTSLIEGLRLALHGPLALGRRVSRRQYHDHLRRRIHRPAAPTAVPPRSAAVTVEFDFVREAVPRAYTVSRRWRVTGNGLVDSVDVLEDGQPPADVEPEHYDAFLRELVPASAGDLFFFDGEKVERLTDDEAAQEVLADAVEHLLGLHLVTQLDDDLEVYLARAEEAASHEETESELRAAQAERDALAAEVARITQVQEENREAMGMLRVAIANQEQDLASKGGGYAKRIEKLKQERRQLKSDVEVERRHLQEACVGLVPFAVAPTLARRVLARLETEARYHGEQAAAALLEDRKEVLVKKLGAPAFWKEVGMRVPATQKLERLADLVTAMLAPSGEERVPSSEVFLHASEQDRISMVGQLEQALGPVAQVFHEAARRLDEREADLERVERELAMVPSDLILQPIFDALQSLEREAEQRAADEERLARELATAQLLLERAENKVERVKDALVQRSRLGDRADLAVRTQRAMRAYAAALRARKLDAFSRELVRRFNALCRKDGLIDGAHVDPETFVVTLRRGRDTFGRNELSAGEKQVYAVAALWALREVAGIPLPVVVDTPLGRLDSDHRLAMIRTFFPQVAHQVVLLATDTEVDPALAAELAPALSHGYRLEFDPATGSTRAEWVGPADLEAVFLVEEIAP